MNNRVKELSAEALTLGLNDRVELIDLILASVQSSPDSIHNAWTVEVADRVRAYERGEFVLVDADDAIAQARTKLRR